MPCLKVCHSLENKNNPEQCIINGDMNVHVTDNENAVEDETYKFLYPDIQHPSESSVNTVFLRK